MWAAAEAAATHVCQEGVAAATNVGGLAGRPWRRPSLARDGGGGGRRNTLGSRGSGGGCCWRVLAGAAAAARHGCHGGVARHGCQGGEAAAAVGRCRRVRRPPPQTGVKGEWRRPLFAGFGGCGGRRHRRVSRGSGGGCSWRVSAGTAAAATHGCHGGVAVAATFGGLSGRWWRRPPLADVSGCGGRRQTRVSRGIGGGRHFWWGCRERLAAATVVRGGAGRSWRWPPLAGVGGCGGRSHTLV